MADKNIKKRKITIKLLVIIGSIALLFKIIPNIASFNYKYEIGGTWNYPTIEAPISFPVYKSREQFTKEKIEASKNINPFYYYDSLSANSKIHSFRERLYAQPNSAAIIGKLRAVDTVFTVITRNGIIKYDEYISKKDPSYIICIEEGKKAKYSHLGTLHSVDKANNIFHNKIKSIDSINVNEIENIARMYFSENIFLDRDKTEYIQRQAQKNISQTHDMIHKGEVIAYENEYISENVFMALESLRMYYEDNNLAHDSWSRRIASFIFFLSLIISFFALLVVYSPDLIIDTRKFLVIFLTIGIACTLIFLSQKIFHKYVYIVPICIVPIILRAFFDHKVAFWGLILSSIIIATVIPNGFQYAIDLIITGTIVIACLSKLEKRSQYFFIIFVIFISFSFLEVIHEFSESGNIRNFNFLMLMNYAINAFLTILAFPVTFYIEKISGMTTEVSLIEYSNINNKILRDLSNFAPGTFQHSIQVANLAENAARKIGANVLLTRVGALYHDIGKIGNPQYFSENQVKGENPHNNLTPRESTAILQNHLSYGVELATKNHLPENIKDFIRTHHGTRLTSFFYSKAVAQESAANVNEEDFRYRGPKPYSRETALIMMADSVEAVSKTLTTPDECAIDNLVDNIVNKQIEEKQFDNTDLTFKEIEEIKDVFKARLKSFFHLRVKYPS